MSKPTLYMVYDNEKGDERIGSFNAEDASKLLGIKQNQVPVYASSKKRYNKRYLFVSEPKEPIVSAMDNFIRLDWDFTTAAFKAMAGGGKRGS